MQSAARPRGDWWIRWKCPHGHLHRELIGPKSKAVEESQRRRLERPCPARDAKPTTYLLGDVIDEYLKSIKPVKRSYRDDARYGKAWKARFGGRALEEIRAGDLEKIRTERLAKRTPATVNRELAFLKRVYSIAIRDERTDRTPFARLKLLREPSGRVRYLTDEEEARLMEKLSTDADRDRVRVLLQTGLRKGEFLRPVEGRRLQGWRPDHPAEQERRDSARAHDLHRADHPVPAPADAEFLGACLPEQCRRGRPAVGRKGVP